jgi:hypothetical protein
VSWSGDGQTLATGGDDGSVKLWNRDGSPITTLDAQQGSVRSVSWSGDGQTLATGGLDGSVKLWNRDGSPITTLDAQQGRVRSVSWSGDGQTLATGGDDGSVKLWPLNNLDLDQLLERGCNWLDTYLINTPLTLQTLTACQTPSRTRAAAANLVVDSEQLARRGEVDKAISGFATAKQWDSGLQVNAKTWNSLCWFGSTYNQAAKVLFACEQAVTLEPQNAGYLDSRGLARALTNNIPGAIADFTAYINATDNAERKAQRQTWISDLQAGKNPFTPEVLKSLCDQ